MYLRAVTDFYISGFSATLTLHKRQNQLLQEIVRPWAELTGREHAPTMLVRIASQTDCSAAFEPVCAHNASGIRTCDLANAIYPALKYHSLYAPPSVRDLPRQSLGRLFLQVEELWSSGSPLNFCPLLRVTFNHDIRLSQSHYCAREARHSWKDANVFSFVITTPPPYRISVDVINTQTSLAAVSLPAKQFKIKKLLTQGERARTFSCRRVDSKPPGDVVNNVADDHNKSHDNPDSSDCVLALSWVMYTDSLEMFIPTGGGSPVKSNLQATPFFASEVVMGRGQWGDLAVFTDMMVEAKPEALRRMMRENPSNLPQIAASIPDETIGESHPGVAPRRPLCGLSKWALDELLFHSAPSLVSFSDAIATQFGLGDVTGATNAVDIHANCCVALREFVGSLIIASRGSVVQKAAMLFDLFGHHDPNRLSAAAESRNDKLLQYADDLPYRPAAVLEEGDTQRQYLPEMTLRSILKDGRTKVNCISLAEAVACTQLLLRRNCIFVDNYEAYLIGASLFAPSRQVPRILAASLSTIKSIVRVDEKHDPSNPIRTAVVRVIDGDEVLPKSEFHELTQDVTQSVTEATRRTAVRTGLYGLDFSTLSSLGQLGIKDPFPTSPKSLRIAFTPTGALESIDVVTLEIAESGAFVSGCGGNLKKKASATYLEEVPTHLRNIGTFGMLHRQALSQSRLLDASFVFDIHRVLIDKILFLSRLMGSPLLRQCLSRPNAMERFSWAKEVVPCLVKVSLAEHMGFKEMKPSSKQWAVTPVHTNLGTSESGGSPMDVISLPIHFAQGISAASDIDSAVALPSRLLTVSLRSAKDLHKTDFFKKQDPYCRLILGDQVQKSRVISRGGTKPVWDEVFAFQFQAEEKLRIEIYDSDTFGKDDYIGEAEIWLLDWRQQSGNLQLTAAQTKNLPELPVMREGAQKGTLNITLDLQEESPNTARDTNAGSGNKQHLATQVSVQDDYIAGGESVARRSSKAGNTIKLVVKSAQNLPSSSISPYCRAACGRQVGRTATLIQPGSDPQWHASFSFTAAEVATAVIKLTVHNTAIEALNDSIVGECRLMVQRLLDRNGCFEGDVELQTPGDKGPAGSLSIRITTTDDNRISTLPFPTALRLVFESAQIQATTSAHASVGMLMAAAMLTKPSGEVAAVQSAALLSSDGMGVLWPDETHDIFYSGEEMLRLRLFDVDDSDHYRPIGSCNFSIWDHLVKGGNSSVKGTVLLNDRGVAAARLRFSLHFMHLGVPRPALFTLGLRFYHIFEAPDAEDAGNRLNPIARVTVGGAVRQTPLLSGSGSQGDFRTIFYFEPPAVPLVRVELHDGRTGDAPAEGFFNMVDAMAEGKSDGHTQINLVRNGVPYGWITLAYILTEEPRKLNYDFCKVFVKQLQFSDDGPRGLLEEWQRLKLQFTLRETAWDVPANGSNPAQIDGGIDFREVCVLDCHQRPGAILYVKLSDDSSTLIATGELNLWALAAKATQSANDPSVSTNSLVIPKARCILTDNSGAEISKLALAFDFFNRAVPLEDLHGWRVSVERAHLGLELPSDFVPKIKVWLSPDNAKLTMKGGCGPKSYFPKEQFHLLAQGDADVLFVSLLDAETLEPRAYGYAQLWDATRSPAAVSLAIPLRHSLAQSHDFGLGVITVCVQPIPKLSIIIAFGYQGDYHGQEAIPVAGGIVSDDSLAEIRAKVTRVCRNIAKKYVISGEGQQQQSHKQGVCAAGQQPTSPVAPTSPWSGAMTPEVASALHSVDLRMDTQLVIKAPPPSQPKEFILFKSTDTLQDLEQRGLVLAKQGAPLFMKFETHDTSLEGRSVMETVVHEGSDVNIRQYDEASIERWPMALTSFPPVTCTGKSSENNFLQRGVQSKKYRHSQVEVVAGHLLPATTLAWVQLNTADFKRPLNHQNLFRLRTRTSQWLPCVTCQQINGDYTEIALQDFEATRTSAQERIYLLGVASSAIVSRFSRNGVPITEAAFAVPMPALSPTVARQIISCALPWLSPAFAYRNRDLSVRVEVSEPALTTSIHADESSGMDEEASSFVSSESRPRRLTLQQRLSCGNLSRNGSRISGITTPSAAA